MLYDLTDPTCKKESSREVVACLLNWDTIEAVDGYKLNELRDLSDILNNMIQKMERLDCAGQLYLFN